MFRIAFHSSASGCYGCTIVSSSPVSPALCRVSRVRSAGGRRKAARALTSNVLTSPFSTSASAHRYSLSREYQERLSSGSLMKIFEHPVKGQCTRPHYHYIHKGCCLRRQHTVRRRPDRRLMISTTMRHVRHGDGRCSWQDTIRARVGCGTGNAQLSTQMV
jgi:hypothetical protein